MCDYASVANVTTVALWSRSEPGGQPSSLTPLLSFPHSGAASLLEIAFLDSSNYERPVRIVSFSRPFPVRLARL